MHCALWTVSDELLKRELPRLFSALSPGSRALTDHAPDVCVPVAPQSSNKRFAPVRRTASDAPPVANEMALASAGPIQRLIAASSR
jgi:hypothetical protein